MDEIDKYEDLETFCKKCEEPMKPTESGNLCGDCIDEMEHN